MHRYRRLESKGHHARAFEVLNRTERRNEGMGRSFAYHYAQKPANPLIPSFASLAAALGHVPVNPDLAACIRIRLPEGSMR
jgi:hypothetical protein